VDLEGFVFDPRLHLLYPFAVNVHHLELFFYVAKYGGISSAVRHMPYGIQQPAISGQILQLEEFLGQKLFQRRPFALTPTGDRLFRFIQPFFENLQLVSDELRGHGEKKLRLAASSALLRDFGPLLLGRLRKQIPDLKLILREADQSMAENYLLSQEVDLAVTELHARPPSGIRSETLIELPLVLLVGNDLKIKKAEDLLSTQPLPLISTPASSAIYKTFQDGLRKRNLVWEIGIEMSTLEMIQTYAAAGYGIGLSILAPGAKLNPELKAVQLPGFPRMKLAAFWQEPLPMLPSAFLAELRAEAKRNAL
jgi:DNA-binding transcriptional LysR family regulator